MNLIESESIKFAVFVDDVFLHNFFSFPPRRAVTHSSYTIYSHISLAILWKINLYNRMNARYKENLKMIEADV